MKLSKLHIDVYTGGILTAVGLYFYLTACKFSEEASVFPKIVLGAFIILSLALLAEGIIKTNKGDTQGCSIKFEEIKIPLIIFSFTTLYVIALNLIGFYLATLIFIPSVMLFYKQKNKVLIVCSTLGTILFIHFLFVVQLQLMLP